MRRLDVLGGGLEPEPHLRVVVDVAKGYFVRSLARDLAEALGTFGHLTALRRTRSGAFTHRRRRLARRGSRVAPRGAPPDRDAPRRARCR